MNEDGTTDWRKTLADLEAAEFGVTRPPIYRHLAKLPATTHTDA